MTFPAPRSPVAPGFWRNIFMSAVAILLAIAITTPLTSRLDPVIGDFLLAHHQREVAKPAQDIVIVAITEESLAALPYRSPIDRQFLAKLVKTIDAGSPKIIGLDILLDSPTEPTKDQQLFEVIDTAATPVVLANVTGRNGLTEKQASYLSGVLEKQLSGSIVLQRDEIDGVLRHLPLLQDENGNNIPAFASVLANPENPPSYKPGRILYQPAMQNGSASFVTYPAHTLDLLPPEWFSGKTVLIGTDLPIIDRHRPPVANSGSTSDGSLPGIEVHAHILNQLLAERSVYTISYWHVLALVLLTTSLSVAAFSLTSRPGLFFTGLAVTSIFYALCWYFLIGQEVAMLPLVAPPASALFAVLLLSLLRWWQDRSEKAFLEVAFSKYVSQSVVRRLTSGNLKLALGGEKRLVTYLFTDLEGFTKLSQSLPPEDMGSILNEYLDRMCDLATSHGATIDKIIGDAMVCFFGAPDENPNQASSALKLAIALDKLCEKFRSDAHVKGIALGTTRIGVHTGEAIVGNFGGKRFFDYTGIGDTVNIAARLEGVNRFLGTRICVSKSVVDRCQQPSFRPVGNLVLKGRNTPVECFEPCSDETMDSSWMKAYLHAYRLMEAKHPDTQAAYEKASGLNPEDGPTRFHLNRLNNGIVDAQVTMWEK